MSTSNTSMLLRFVLLGLPTVVVSMTLFSVLFGEQGLLELAQLEEQLVSVELEIRSVQAKNRQLELQIRRLRSSPVQVEMLTAKEFQKAHNGTTVYRFNE